MKQWTSHAQEFLDELLQHEAPKELICCETCGAIEEGDLEGLRPIRALRCQDCCGCLLECPECCVDRHQKLPFHVIEVCQTEIK